MIHLTKILVPTDFSPHSEVALKYGCEFAQKFGAELHLLYVIQDLISDFDGFYAMPGNYMAEIKAESERRIGSFLDPKWNQGKGVVRKTQAGTPFLEILRYAEEKKIDLIVMGTHGRGAIAHALMGSVAEKVVRKAACPVLTVRHPEHEFVMP
jgi:nucleotide-binding universal stress UspA family protein